MSAEPLNSINSPTPILPPQPFATPDTVGIQPQPFVAPVQIGLVSNQTAPIQIFGEVPLSSLHGTFAVCPSCKSTVHTNVTKKFSCLNCLACYFCFHCWWIYKCAFAKDYNCYDAEHSCPKCGAHIGTYSTC